MADIIATVDFTPLADDYCFTTPQQYQEDLANSLQITIPGSAAFYVGATAPADHSNIWVRTVGGYLEGVYIYMGGWYRPHPVPPGSNAYRAMYVGTNDASGLWSFDGGDGTDPAAATAVTGSFWMVDTNFNFKIPMGPGTGTNYGLPGTPRSLAVTGTLGEEMHALTYLELAVHAHYMSAAVQGTIGLALSNYCGQWLNGTGNSDYTLTGTATPATIGLTSEQGNNDAHENLPPVYGTYIIKRSVRQYYVAT